MIEGRSQSGPARARRTGTLLAGLAGLALAVSAQAGEPPVVEAEAGAVRGVWNEEIAMFRGIPYAEAPVGELRWKPPMAKAHWEGVGRDRVRPTVLPARSAADR